MTAAGRGVLTREGSRTCCGVPRDAGHATGRRPPTGGRAAAGSPRRAGTASAMMCVAPRRHGRPGPWASRGARDDVDGDGAARRREAERGERGVARRAELHVPGGRGRRGRARGTWSSSRRPTARACWARSSTSRSRCGDQPLSGHGVVIGTPRRQPRRRARPTVRRSAGATLTPARPHELGGLDGTAGRHDDDRHLAHRGRRRRREPAGRRLQPAHLPLRPERVGQDLRPRGAARAAPAADRPADGRVRPQRRLRAPRLARCPAWPRPRPRGSPTAACGCCAATPRAPRATSRCGCGSAR